MVDTLKFTEWLKHGDTDYKSAKILWEHHGDNKELIDDDSKVVLSVNSSNYEGFFISTKQSIEF